MFNKSRWGEWGPKGQKLVFDSARLFQDVDTYIKKKAHQSRRRWQKWYRHLKIIIQIA